LHVVHRRIGAALAGALVATLLGAAGLAAGPAGASVPGLQYIPGTSATDSVSQKLGSGICPGLKKPLGGGAAISGGAGQVGLVGFGPDEGASSFGRAAEDQDGFGGAWSVGAVATCARLGSPTTPEIGGIWDYTRVIQISASNSDNKAMIANCPPGLKLFGSGARIVPNNSADFGQFVFDGLTPSADLTSVRAEAFEDQDGTAATWRLEVTAVCAQPVAGLTLASGTTGPGSSNRFATASCPPGTVTLSAAADLTGAVGQVRLAGMTMISFFGDGVLASADEDQDGTAATWTMNAYAICATA
jgi:hypothetical protein